VQQLTDQLVAPVLRAHYASAAGSMDPNDELVFLLLDGARYGDMEDVDSALAQHCAVDSKDASGKTGAWACMGQPPPCERFWQ
jgi:hypothetical protein